MAKMNLKYAVWKEGKYYVAQCLNVEDIITPKITKIERVQTDQVL